MRNFKNLKEYMFNYLVVGKLYTVDNKKLYSKRRGKTDEDFEEKPKLMECIGKYRNFATFKDVRFGTCESILYQDAFRLFIKEDEDDI